MKSISDKSVDMILCDLPYGTTACKWDSVIPFELLWQQYERIIKCDGVIVLFGQEPFSSAARMSKIDMYRYDWVWVKDKPSNFQLMNYQPGRIHENIMVFSKSKACFVKNGEHISYNPQKTVRDIPRTSNVKIYGNANLLHNYNTKDNVKTYSHRMPISLLRFNPVRKRVHPTQKPIDLLEYLILTYTEESDVVLDNCMGSGSTGVACANTKRKFIGIELDKNYFEIAKTRIENAVFENNKGE